MWKVAVIVLAFAWTIRTGVKQAIDWLLKHPFNLSNHLSRQKSGKALLVIAHPDDECMFFAPSIQAFVRSGWTIDVLCITSGNADGLGDIRKEELEGSCKVLGIKQFIIIDDQTNFPDSMTLSWDTSKLADTILDYIEQDPDIDIVLTFDPEGISGHTNHKDTCQSVRMALLQLEEPIELYELVSLPLIVKYSSILSYIYEAVSLSVDMTINRTGAHYLFSMLTFSDAIRYCYSAMKQHKSQLLWFRRLYLIFSRYCILDTIHVKQIIDHKED